MAQALKIRFVSRAIKCYYLTLTHKMLAIGVALPRLVSEFYAINSNVFAHKLTHFAREMPHGDARIETEAIIPIITTVIN